MTALALDRPAAPARRRAAGFWTPGVVAACLGLATAAAVALVPGLIAPLDPIETDSAGRLQGPSPAHLFGTDQLGRDVFSRVVHGAGTTIAATAIAVVIGLLAGSALGLVAGFLGGRADTLVMRGVDVLLAIPGLLLAMVVVTALGFGTLNVAIAVGVSSVASFARIMRSEVLRVRTSTYVEAAFAGGESVPYVLVKHVLPNSWGPVLAMTALEFGGAVLAVSALSFLGYGVVPPDPEWGSLISEGRNYLGSAWWMTTLPGLVLLATVVSANHIGRRLNRHTGGGRA
jgi:peptide/nickel transport system permease protein